MKLGITVGDVCGIGPEVILKALKSLSDPPDLVVYGNRQLLEDQANFFNLPVPAQIVDIQVDGALPGRDDFGTLHPGAARIQLAAFKRAMEDAANGTLGGIVTAPWTKALMDLIHHPVVGHTELLAERFDKDQRHVMMLAGPRLRVSLVTIHIPLAEVASAVTQEGILRVIQTTDLELKKSFGIERPRLAVCGLNPHAGERGHIGVEDEEVTKVALADAQAEGIHVEGPFPADALFPKFAKDTPYDAVIAMYHDQGLVPLKTIHRGEAVNITLGISIVRTSVDHGSAYDIAGQGVASETSLIQAIEQAKRMTANRQKFAS